MQILHYSLKCVFILDTSIPSHTCKMLVFNVVKVCWNDLQ